MSKKSFVAIVVSIVIIPQVTFAAWWNPVSWGIFSFSNNTQVKIKNEISVPVSPTIGSVETKISSTTDTLAIETTKKITRKTQHAVTVKSPTQTRIPEPVKPLGTLCNGTYWNSCPLGQNLICPSTGGAYCQAPQKPIEQTLKKDNYQICRDSYGHAIWDGTSYASDGGPSCSCDTGYGPNSEGTSCVAVQQTQSVPQPDYSINNSACQTATQNLENFETSYANNYASLSSAIAANNTIQARLRIFANQYNTALPSYQMATQAACKVPASNSQCQITLQKFDTFQSQNTLSSNNTSGTSQIFGNRSAMELGNYQTEIYYSCQ